MRRWMFLFLTPAMIVLGAACAVPVDEPVGEAASRQVPPDFKYAITQLGTLVASEWAGTISNGNTVEYWVAKPGYNAAAARTLTGTSATCAEWKAEVCGSGWTGSTYYRATYVETTLDCAFPPDPCRAPRGAVSFLSPGSYQMQSGAAGPYAWTYVSGACEYWSMNHLVSTGTSTQSPLTAGWSSLGAFESAMCAKSPVPSTWFTVYYTPVANFCSASTC